MARYTVKWEMIYEDAENEFDAIAQAYAHICEIANDPSMGANYVAVINNDTPNCHTMVQLDDALNMNELLNEGNQS